MNICTRIATVIATAAIIAPVFITPVYAQDADQPNAIYLPIVAKEAQQSPPVEPIFARNIAERRALVAYFTGVMSEPDADEQEINASATRDYMNDWLTHMRPELAQQAILLGRHLEKSIEVRNRFPAQTAVLTYFAALNRYGTADHRSFSRLSGTPSRPSYLDTPMADGRTIAQTACEIASMVGGSMNADTGTCAQPPRETDAASVD